MRHLVLLSFLLFNLPTGNAAWPHLGEAPDSKSAADLPRQLNPAENTAWITDLPGPGASTPLVYENRIYLTCEIEGKNSVVCLDDQGKMIWETPIDEGTPGKHRNATGANPSLATDGTHLISYFKNSTVACCNMDGDELWQVNLADKYGPGKLWWDLGNSPILSSQGAVLAVMHDGDSYLLTLDIETGQEIWRTPRQYECADESDQSYTTPVITTENGTETIITFGADHLTSHDAITGQLRWESGGFNPENSIMWRTISSPVVYEDLVLVSYGRGEHLAAVQLGGSGDVTDTHRSWTLPQIGCDVPTPVFSGGKAFILGDKGAVYCINPLAGEKLWTANLPKARDKYFCTPLVVENLMYCVREDGATFVCDTSEEMKVLSESSLDENTVATPVLIGNDILVRTRERLLRFEK